MYNRFSFLLFILIFITSCGQKEVKTEIFNEDNPYTLELKKDRSYYQAEKIASRLNKMGLGAYILEENTSDGVWYRIMSGALKDSAAVAEYTHLVDSAFHLKPTAILDYTSMDSLERTPIRDITVVERSRIDANPPAVPQQVNDVIRKFPENNMFYLQNISILTLTSKSITSSEGHKIDMPRGVSLSYLKNKECSAIAAVIYEDNLYGDRFTLHVVKCKERAKPQTASLIPTRSEYNEMSIQLCSDIADKILNTGSYKDENKDVFEADAYSHLSGYKVSFVTKGNRRVYYIFTDESGDYIYMAQSTKEDDKEIIDFLSGIGKGEGLVDFDEFYNTFYTMPDNPAEDDVFLGYYVDRLTWSYAKEKGYQNWAKRMVGHWQATCYFHNQDKGAWHFSLFDLLTPKAKDNIYNTLYRSKLDKDNKRKIYGVEGAAIYQLGWWEYQLTEVNFGYDRYVIALNGTSYYTERDLIRRAELLQLLKGGYNSQNNANN